jgi:hypothetical protein
MTRREKNNTKKRRGSRQIHLLRERVLDSHIPISLFMLLM